MNNTPFPEQEDSYLPDEEAVDIPEVITPPADDLLPPLESTEPELTEAENAPSRGGAFLDITSSIDNAISEETEDTIPPQTPPTDEDPEVEKHFGAFERIDPSFEEILDPTPAAPETPVSNRTPLKGRPRRKRGEGLLGIPNILTTLVWAALVLVIGITLGRMMWICATDILAFGRQDRTVTVTIYETDTIDDITDKLYRSRLIKYPGLFKFYASFAVDEGDIKPGIWDLNTLYDYHALVKMMAPSSQKEVVKVMIPEGYSCRQIFDLLQDYRVCTNQALADYATNGELDDYWFLEGVERGSKYCLEGFLFPDTYEFYKNESPENVLNKMLKNFDNRFSEELRDSIEDLNKKITQKMRADGKNNEYIEKHQLTLPQIITIASMIEKETASSAESFDIASVIYNRLFSWGSTPAYLNIDATIVYALDGKTDLSLDDLQVDSPYNTYFNVGLTPGPISNPGLNSIKAALQPNETPYYFYVLDPSTNVHHFSRTIEEHNAFRASLGD